MKGTLVFATILCVQVFCINANANASDEISFSVGASSKFVGLGASVNFESGSDTKYVSVGCLSISNSSYSGTSSNCGLGFGWIKADMFSLGNKHAFGAHIGVTDNNVGRRNDSTDTYLAFSYNYYLNSINNKGWSFGVTPLTLRNHRDNSGIGLDVAYHF